MVVINSTSKVTLRPFSLRKWLQLHPKVEFMRALTVRQIAPIRQIEKMFRVSKRNSKWGLRLNEKTILHGLETFFKYVEHLGQYVRAAPPDNNSGNNYVNVNGLLLDSKYTKKVFLVLENNSSE